MFSVEGLKTNWPVIQEPCRIELSKHCEKKKEALVTKCFPLSVTKSTYLVPLALWSANFFKFDQLDISLFDENCRKFSKREENTVGKGEIARYKQFPLFPLCFQKTCTADT